jgi:hypothetical protein
VRELDASRVPGARADRCLLFETDGVFRRAWTYPSDWAALTDDELVVVMESRDAAYGFRFDAAPLSPVARALLGQSNVVMARARTLLAMVTVARATARALFAEQRTQLDRCRRARLDMRAAIETYATTLLHAGVAQDEAVNLVARATRSGLADGPTAIGDSEADRLFHDAADWCRQIYAVA